VLKKGNDGGGAGQACPDCRCQAKISNSRQTNNQYALNLGTYGSPSYGGDPTPVEVLSEEIYKGEKSLEGKQVKLSDLAGKRIQPAKPKYGKATANDVADGQPANL
jgi:hypothetical protein